MDVLAGAGSSARCAIVQDHIVKATRGAAAAWAQQRHQRAYTEKNRIKRSHCTRCARMHKSGLYACRSTHRQDPGACVLAPGGLQRHVLYALPLHHLPARGGGEDDYPRQPAGPHSSVHTRLRRCQQGRHVQVQVFRSTRAVRSGHATTMQVKCATDKLLMDSPDRALLCTRSTENMLEKQDGKLGPLVGGGGGKENVCEQTVKIIYFT